MRGRQPADRQDGVCIAPAGAETGEVVRGAPGTPIEWGGEWGAKKERPGPPRGGPGLNGPSLPGQAAPGRTMILTLRSLWATSSSKPRPTMSASSMRPVISGVTSKRPSAMKAMTSANSPA